MPDGRTVVAASTEGKRVTRFDLISGTRLADITLPHATGRQLFLVRAEKRPYIGAMGALATEASPPAPGSISSIPARPPSAPPVAASPSAASLAPALLPPTAAPLFFPDRVSNTAMLLKVAGVTEAKQVAVDQTPEAGFLMNEDRFGVTINSAARTASGATALPQTGGGEEHPDAQSNTVTERKQTT